MSAKTEPKMHSPAAAAAHSPAEAPDPIPVVLASRTWIKHCTDREPSCGLGNKWNETLSRHLSHFQDSVRDPRRIPDAP